MDYGVLGNVPQPTRKDAAVVAPSASAPDNNNDNGDDNNPPIFSVLPWALSADVQDPLNPCRSGLEGSSVGNSNPSANLPNNFLGDMSPGMRVNELEYFLNCSY